MPGEQYWVIASARDLVMTGMRGGFAGIEGIEDRLRQIRIGDWVVFFSHYRKTPQRRVIRRFTALGWVTGADVFATDLATGLTCHRREIRYLPCREVPLRALGEDLEFTAGQEWRDLFDYGLIRIQREDFLRIAHEMAGNLQLAGIAG